MNYVKLQADLLKMADKRDKGVGRPARLVWGKSSDDVTDQTGIVINGYYIVFILEDQRYIDLEKICGGPRNCIDINRIMKDPRDAIEATDTGVIKTKKIRFNGDRKTKIHIFKTENASEIWIDENNLKYFDLDNSTFKGTNQIGPIYIYESDPVNRLVGYVLPIRPVDAEDMD